MKIHGIKIGQKRQYFKDAVQKSQDAMHELNQEVFNSKTLDTLFYNPRFRATEPNTCMIQSRTTGEPVKVHIDTSIDTFGNKKWKSTDYYKVVLSPADQQEISLQNADTQSLLYFPSTLGSKYFSIENKHGRKIANYGSMSSNADNLAGIGIREDEVQIKEALSQGIKSISRRAFAHAIWYHLKMGFTPVQQLRRVKSIKDVNKRICGLTTVSPDISAKNYTPIIVQKKDCSARDIILMKIQLRQLLHLGQ